MISGLTGWLDLLAEKQIPILKQRRNQVLEVLNDEDRSVSECRSILLSDPGMAANLLRSINRERIKANRLPITTISSLLSLLGVARLRSELKAMTCIEDMSLPERNLAGAQHCLKQSWYCSQFAMRWALDREVREPEEVHLAAILQCLPELMLWCYGGDAMLKIEHLAYCKCHDYFDVVSKIIGCHKREIGASLAKKWGLPELVEFGFETEYDSFTNGTAVGLAALLSRLCLHGWYGKDMAFFLQKAMHYFGADEVKTTRRLHQQSLDIAADELEQGFRPIASLLLATNLERLPEPEYCYLSAVKKEPEPVEEQKKPVREVLIENESTPEMVEVIDPLLFKKDVDQLKVLVKQQAKMNELLKHVVISLHDTMKFSRVGFLLMSADKLKLECKINKCTDEADNAIKQLSIELDKQSLFSLLMKKPQAFSLNENNYDKYWSLVAGKVKTAIQVDRFCVTSVFFGEKPIGIIYVDRSQNSISPDDFKAFQQMTMMLNKGLELLAKK